MAEKPMAENPVSRLLLSEPQDVDSFVTGNATVRFTSSTVSAKPKTHASISAMQALIARTLPESNKSGTMISKDNDLLDRRSRNRGRSRGRSMAKSHHRTLNIAGTFTDQQAV